MSTILGTYTQSGKQTQIAIKLLKEGASMEARDDFEREVEIMSTFDHQNIVKLLGVVIKGLMNIIFERMR